MTKQRLLFCKEYIIDLNATQAAIRAKYSEHTARTQGSKLLTCIDIQEEIQRLMNKRAVKAELTAKDVLNSILDIRGVCMQRIDVTAKDLESGDRVKVGEALLDTNGALRANELLGKHLKLFTERTENVTHNINEEVTELTTEERKARIKELMEKNKNG